MRIQICMEKQRYRHINAQSISTTDTNIHEYCFLLQRQKYIQPDTLMKNMSRPIPKAKILEGLKKRDETTLSTSSYIDQSNQTTNKTQNSLTKMMRTSLTTLKSSQPRKSIGKKIDVKPQNTIRSMFQKQMEKSRIENSQANGTLNQMAMLNLNDSTTPEKSDEAQPKTTQDAKPQDAEVDAQQSNVSLMTGPLHKRLTRRNSMTMHTPTKTTAEAHTEISSVKKRRCTVFMPSFNSTIEENDDKVVGANKTDSSKCGISENVTINKTIAMDMCGAPKTVDENKCNSKVRNLLNSELMATPRSLTGSVKKVQASSSLRRRTTYTPRPMEETKMQSAVHTPISAVKGRQTMNFNISSQTKPANPPDLIQTKSCEAIVMMPVNEMSSKSI